MKVAVLLVLAAVVLFAASGVAGHYDSRLRKHGPHALTWRWLTASAGWHGRPVTNRGWTRPGTKALTPTGHAHRRWYLPRWQHALWRIQWTLVTLLTCASLLFRFRRTAEYLAVTAVAGAAWGAWRTRAWAQDYGHRKNYVKPLHARLASDAGIPAANKPESWLEIPKDRSHAVLTWPKGAPLPKPQERDGIASVAASTLGLSGAVVKWQFTGPQLKLHLRRPVPCPALVTLADILDAIRDAGLSDLILGMGQEGRISSVSLQNDSPHIGMSMDSGKGKSVTARVIIPQILFRGGIALVLDNKLVSHPWARGLPNVAYADDIEKIHDACVWLDAELRRRAEFVRRNTNIYGELTGSPGPRLVVLAEELNLTMNRLKAYWDELTAEDKALPKDERENLPAVSPAVRGLENCSYVGRELKVHEIFVGQRLSAAATGGGSKGADVRMNIGTRLLAGYDDDTWKMLVGKGTPMPPPSRHAGRVQVYVKGSGLTETQVAFVTHREARQLAEAGSGRVPGKLQRLTLLPESDSRQVGKQDRTPVRNASGPAAPAILAVPQDAPPPLSNWMTIRQATEQGLLPASWTNPGGSFRVAKSRAKKAGVPVPEVKATKGSENWYDAVDLADFLESLTKERQAA